ncbi:hypothetical protein SprV_0602105800 [Sparganum proliferum]
MSGIDNMRENGAVYSSSLTFCQPCRKVFAYSLGQKKRHEAKYLTGYYCQDAAKRVSHQKLNDVTWTDARFVLQTARKPLRAVTPPTLNFL